MPLIVSKTVAVPTSVAAGVGTRVDDVGRMTVFISGTFAATVQLQIAHEDVAASYRDIGSAFTAGGFVEITESRSYIRANVTAFTSGAAVASIRAERPPQGG
jgi:hypothetical protein